MILIALLALGLAGLISLAQVVVWRARTHRSPHATEHGVTEVRCGFALKRGWIPVGGAPYPVGRLLVSDGQITLEAKLLGIRVTWERNESSIEWIPHPSGLGKQLRIKDREKSARAFVRTSEPIDAALPG